MAKQELLFELQNFVVCDVQPRGRLGEGYYGRVVELEVNGRLYAGKQLREEFFDLEEDGVANLKRRYLHECQVIGSTCNQFIM